MSVRRRVAAAGVAAAAVLAVATAVPAAADTVTVTWLCTSEAGEFTGDYHVTVTAQATAAVGSTHPVSVSAQGAQNQDQHIEAGTISATLEVQLGGAGSGVVTATGLSNPDIRHAGRGLLHLRPGKRTRPGCRRHHGRLASAPAGVVSLTTPAGQRVTQYDGRAHRVICCRGSLSQQEEPQ